MIEAAKLVAPLLEQTSVELVEGAFLGIADWVWVLCVERVGVGVSGGLTGAYGSGCRLGWLKFGMVSLDIRMG